MKKQRRLKPYLNMVAQGPQGIPPVPRRQMDDGRSQATD